MRKVRVGLAVLLLMVVVVYLVGSVTRTISATSDNKETLIRNSNGNYWEPTCQNIQVAIDNLGSGGTVWLPARIFVCTSAIEPNSNTRLQGSGIGNTIIKADPSFYDVNGFGLIKGLESRNLHHITLSDFTVDGNRENSPNSNSCITFHGVEDFIIKNVWLTSPGGSGLNLRNDCTRGLISNVYATDILGPGAQGFSVNSANECTFSDCVAWDAGGFGMDFSRMHNCNFNNLLVYDSVYGIKVPGTSERQTENCTFNNLVMTGLKGGEGLKIQYVKHSSFSNVYVEGASNGINFFSTCENDNLNNFHVSDSTNVGLAISGNNINVNNGHVKNSGAYGLSISSTNNITVSNTQFRNSGSYNPLYHSSGITISGCKFTGGNSYGLIIRNAHDFIISGCQFSDNVNSGIWVEGDQGVSTDFIISDNILRENTRGIYLDSDSHDNFIVTNNIVLDNTLSNLEDHSTGTNKIVADNLA